MDKNVTYVFEMGEAPRADDVVTTTIAAVGVSEQSQVATNAAEGCLDPRADSARRIVDAYGDTLQRLADT